MLFPNVFKVILLYTMLKVWHHLVLVGLPAVVVVMVVATASSHE